MTAPEGNSLSPPQKRYKELTAQCGLEYEEALYALGRRSGGLPEYRKLSRQAQFNKVQELVGYGLTREEAERVVGICRIQAGQSAHQHLEASPKSEISSRQAPASGPPTEPRSDWSADSSPSGKAQTKCFYCKRADGSVVNVPPGIWLCKKCRRLLRRARRAEKHLNDTASYYNALTHPEFRGLKGVRK